MGDITGEAQRTVVSGLSDKYDKNIELRADKDNNKISYTFQAAIAKAMAFVGNKLSSPPSFIVALGDNFYNNGVKSTTDDQWLSSWSAVSIK
jgi:dTDP-glucose pyrophosphorylase